MQPICYSLNLLANPETPEVVAQMISWPKQNNDIFIKAKYQAVEVDGVIGQISPSFQHYAMTTTALQFVIDCLPLQFGLMYMWAMCLCNKIPNKMKNMYIYGSPNIGKSHIFAYPFKSFLQPINTAFTVDKSFFGQELAQPAFASILDDMVITIKDSLMLEMMKNFPGTTGSSIEY